MRACVCLCVEKYCLLFTSERLNGRFLILNEIRVRVHAFPQSWKNVVHHYCVLHHNNHHPSLLILGFVSVFFDTFSDFSSLLISFPA